MISQRLEGKVSFVKEALTAKTIRFEGMSQLLVSPRKEISSSSLSKIGNLELGWGNSTTS